MKIKLGVMDAKDLRDAPTCYNLGHRATQLGDAVSFSAYHLKSENLTRREVDNISAGLHTSARIAENLANSLAAEPELQKKVKSYKRAASRLNGVVRKEFIEGKNKSLPTENQIVNLRRLTVELVDKAIAIEREARDLCEVESEFSYRRHVAEREAKEKASKK